MDEQDALFARRALGSLGGRRAASSSTKPSPRGEGGGAPPSAEKAQDYQPTPEEMIEIMKLLRDSGLSDAEPPPDVPETLEGMMAKVQRQQQRRNSGSTSTNTIALQTPTPTSGAATAAPTAPPPHQNRIRAFVPSAWMVVKTNTVAPCGPPTPEEGPDTPRRFPFPSGRKVFVNVCSSPAVPAPAAWKAGTTTTTAPSASSSSSSLPSTVEAALDRWATQDDSSSESLRFPLSCGPLRHGSDRRGEPCSVVDVVFSPRVVRAAENHRALRAFLVQLSLEWVAQKYRLELELAEFRLPRLAYKLGAGERGIAEQTLALGARGDLVREVQRGGEPGRGGPAAGSAPPAAGPEEAAGAGGVATAAEKAASTAAAAAAVKKKATPPPPKPPPQRPPPQQRLPFSVSFEGSPATAAVMRVDLLPSQSAEDLASRVAVHVSGAAGRVRVALLEEKEDEGEGEGETTAAAAEALLPFSVSAARSSARLSPDGRSLTVRLPWVPVERAIEELVAGVVAGGKKGPASASALAAVALSAVVSELE